MQIGWPTTLLPSNTIVKNRAGASVGMALRMASSEFSFTRENVIGTPPPEEVAWRMLISAEENDESIRSRVTPEKGTGEVYVTTREPSPA